MSGEANVDVLKAKIKPLNKRSAPVNEDERGVGGDESVSEVYVPVVCYLCKRLESPVKQAMLYI